MLQMYLVKSDCKFMGIWAFPASPLPRSPISIILHKIETIVQKRVLPSEIKSEAFQKGTAYLNSREVKNAR